MKYLFATMVLLAGCKSAPLYPINTAPVEAANEFSRQNPGYKLRAGEFYDRTHISKATKQFYELCSIPKDKRKTALNIVRAYSYDYLDVMVRLGGPVPLPAEERTKLAEVMNARFRTLLSETEYDCYLSWRDASSGENDFAFLTQMPGVTPRPFPIKKVRMKNNMGDWRQ